MFLTWVDSRRNSRPSPWRRPASRGGGRRRPRCASCCRRRPPRPAARPRRSRSTRSYPHRRAGPAPWPAFARAGDDVDHARRQVRGFQHRVEVGRAERVALGGDAITALPIAMAGATSETKPSSGRSSGQTRPSRRSARYPPASCRAAACGGPRRRTCRPRPHR